SSRYVFPTLVCGYAVPRPARVTLVPYTTLFRSPVGEDHLAAVGASGDLDHLSRPGGSVRAVETQARRGTSAPGSVGSMRRDEQRDRKSTRLNSSHEWISYAVFCLKKNST